MVFGAGTATPAPETWITGFLKIRTLIEPAREAKRDNVVDRPGARRFVAELARRQGKGPAGQRRWVFATYDQLNDRVGPLAEGDPRELGLVLLECPAKAARRPYHRQKLALVLSNGRQFALEQAERGVAVRWQVAQKGYAGALIALAKELGPLVAMQPAEWEMRQDIAPAVQSGALELVPHGGWLSTAADFEAAAKKGPPWRMDQFYRQVRQRTGYLMDGKKPVGGAYSYDGENRKPWRGKPAAPTPPRFVPDEVTTEVLELVEQDFASHPGQLQGADLPSTAADAERVWQYAREQCLRHFGPFEDAMSRHSEGLFHTRISPLLNLSRLLPRRVVEDTLALDLPLPSKEGFVRQVLGWREFVHHVHRTTEGFRQLPPGRTRFPLGEGSPLPPAYWGTASGMACLDRVVGNVWRTGYSHHIERLMVLSNLATLMDVSPQELSDWFWAAYTDAYDWVVEPNVLGMGTFALGDLFTTKPYVSGAAYLARMSDDCGACQFDPKTNCPITGLYWAFLERHRAALKGNPRLSMPLVSAAKRSAADRAKDRATFERVSSTLAKGEALAPEPG